MNVLIIGGGGREHALAWKAAQSAQVETVYVAPGNAGTAGEAGMQNLAIGVTDFAALAEFAQSHAVGLTIVGPEQPLVDGIVDYFSERKLSCFGPGKAAAQLEGSKVFARDFLARHNIPGPAYASFTELEAALAYLKQQQIPIVVKADGLAAGKGVVVAASRQQAEQAVRDMLAGNRFGAAGCRVVIEEFLEGEEASFIVLADGKTGPAHGHQPGPQARGRSGHRPQHRGHGRVFTGPGGHPTNPRAHHGGDHPTNHQRHGGGGQPLYRLPLRGFDDRRRRAPPGLWNSTAASATRKPSPS